jgi:SAM-dependent methyltransferase
MAPAAKPCRTCHAHMTGLHHQTRLRRCVSVQGASSFPLPGTSARPCVPLRAAVSKSRRGRAAGPSSVDKANVTDIYFQGYSRIEIHEAMLRDKVRQGALSHPCTTASPRSVPLQARTQAYKRAIMRNSSIFEGKTVLDVGCGTGILSLFAAMAGAEHVYGVDASLMAYKAQQIVKDNGYKDHVTIIHGKVEDIELPVPQARPPHALFGTGCGASPLHEAVHYMCGSILWCTDGPVAAACSTSTIDEPHAAGGCSNGGTGAGIALRARGAFHTVSVASLYIPSNHCMAAIE